MIKKLYFKLELFSLYIRKNFLFLLIGLAVGSASFIFKDRIIGFISSPRFRTKKIGIEGFYTSNNLPDIINNQLTLSLTTITENDKIITSPLVQSLDIQNDNKDYFIKLDTSIKWHTGKSLSAYDIDYQISGATITPIDDSQLKISLNSQFSPFLSLLSKPLFKRDLTGLGPYKVKEISYQDSYIKTLKLVSISPDKPSIIYRFYLNEDDLINAYRLGEVDEIKVSYLPEDIPQWSNSKITPYVQLNEKYVAVFLNTEKFNSKQFRQALSYATPKSEDKNERCLGPISPNSWAYNSQIKEYKYNPSHAKQLLPENSPQKINLQVADRKLLPRAEAVKKAWQEALGVSTEINIRNQADNNKDFDAILAYGGIPSDPDQYLFWHSTQQKTNITRLNNSRIDKLLEEGRQTSDNQTRKKIYQDFQRYLLEESPAIFLDYPTVYTITRTTK